MIDLLRVYVCTECGDVLGDEVSKQEDIDTEHDEIYEYWLHDKCGHEAVPKMSGGAPVYQQVDHERWLWSIGYYDEFIGDEDHAESFD